MKIAIDISQIVYEGSGVTRYTRNLVESLLQYDQKNEYTFFFSSLRRTLNKEIETNINNKYKLKKYRLPPTVLDFLWNRLHVVPIDYFVGDVDLILTSDWTEPPSSSKKLTVVHDLVFLKFPETLHKKIVEVQKRRLYWVKKESTRIIADSHNTKQDLVELLAIPQERIDVVYPAVITNPQKSHEKTRVVKKYRLTKPFILTVGKIEPRKNVGRLISAFLKTKLPDIDLIIVGNKGWGADYYQSYLQRQTTINSKSAKNIRFLGFISDNDLYALYQSALFFVLPSLYEGFGLPVIESMQLGCPVAASNTSSLKEIAGDDALLFNPYDEEQIAGVLVKLAQNENLRATLKEKGLKKGGEFSSKQFAHSLLGIFQNIYDNR